MKDNMKIAFVTTNKHKFEEVRRIFSEFGIDTEQATIDCPEPEGSVDSIAKHKARFAADALKKPVVAEDTGIFFEAYDDFPGSRPKFVFHGIRYDGIMRLLEGKKRDAYFKTAAAFCEPGKDPVIFEGVMKGKITEKIFDKEKDVQPYERIFVPEGHDVTTSAMTREEKNIISHRAKAFRKLGEYLSKKK
jgi:XTP/dITP diphosphohydrolase